MKGLKYPGLFLCILDTLGTQDGFHRTLAYTQGPSITEAQSR